MTTGKPQQSEQAKGRWSMGAMINTGNDVVTFLKTQHEAIESLMQQVASTRGTRARRRFCISARRWQCTRRRRRRSSTRLRAGSCQAAKWS